MKYTKPSWQIGLELVGSNPNIAIEQKATGSIICDIGGGTLEMRMANAHLIARSPDLWSGLKTMLRIGEVSNRSDIPAFEEVRRLWYELHREID